MLIIMKANWIGMKMVERIFEIIKNQINVNC